MRTLLPFLVILFFGCHTASEDSSSILPPTISGDGATSEAVKARSTPLTKSGAQESDAVALVADSDPVLASFTGREIRSSELAKWFFKTHRREAFVALSMLVSSEILEREAAAAGIRYSESEAARHRRQIEDDLTRAAATEYGLRTPKERYVELKFRESYEAHVERRLEDERQRWLFSRVVRYQAMLRERVELAVIVVREEALAREIGEKLDQGADFGRLAVAHSIHESAKNQGMLPPLPKEALHPMIAEAAFLLRNGERTGVIALEDAASVRQFEVVRLVKRHPAAEVRFSEVASLIEAGLSERPLDVFEWGAWQLCLERLYNVKLSATL